MINISIKEINQLIAKEVKKQINIGADIVRIIVREERSNEQQFLLAHFKENLLSHFFMDDKTSKLKLYVERAVAHECQEVKAIAGSVSSQIDGILKKKEKSILEKVARRLDHAVTKKEFYKKIKELDKEK